MTRMARHLLAAGLALVLAVPMALAKDDAAGKRAARVDCGIEAGQDDLHEELRAGAWRAVCVKQGNGCALHQRNGAGYLLQLAHRFDGGQWRVALTLPEGRRMDVGAGVALVVDGGEPQRIPPEFLEDRAAGRAVAARLEVGDAVMELLRSGKRLEWRYTATGGGEERAVFDLACLPALATEVEKRLARMRAMKQLGK